AAGMAVRLAKAVMALDEEIAELDALIEARFRSLFMSCGADAGSQQPNPHADPVRARGCEECREWGSVVNDEGGHELCPNCQTDVVGAETAARSPRTRDGGGRPGSVQAGGAQQVIDDACR
ncbi:hypothetical protein, partial [Streptomyces sp. NPDC055692]|uniref:hypothetical protein n=1 Tax=Streptomyces sp. NPDC055692 TaxID=3155683 RepID=UPI00342F8915